jgi:NodT family efflux transporter outer membrane factor (OMF) lipoprotein
MKNLIIISILLLLAACKVSKDVAVPDIPLPASYNDTSGIAEMPWDTFFTEPELKDLITAAIAHNNDLQSALKDIETAQLTLRQAKLGNIPSVGIQAAAGTNRPSDNSLNGLSLQQYNFASSHIEDYTISASLSWEADIWGKIRSRKAEALAAYLSTREARKTIQTRIVSDVAKGYYNLLMLDAQLAIAKSNVLLNDSTLNIIQLQFDAGQVTLLAVQQVTAQRLTAAGLVPQFEQQITIQENALSILTGSLPGKINHQHNLSGITIAAATGIPSDLLSRRPDIKQAELALQEANARVGYAKANMYPSLTITAQGGLDAIKFSNWFTMPASLFGAVAGGLTQPLFNQRKLNTLYQVAKVEREERVIRFRQAVLVAVGEVADNLVSIDKLQQRQAFSAERVHTLEQAIHNAQMLFGNGRATYLEVITAQANVLQGQLELAGIKKDQLDAGVDLYRAVGGGVNNIN